MSDSTKNTLDNQLQKLKAKELFDKISFKNGTEILFPKAKDIKDTSVCLSGNIRPPKHSDRDEATKELLEDMEIKRDLAREYRNETDRERMKEMDIDLWYNISDNAEEGIYEDLIINDEYYDLDIEEMDEEDED